MILDFLGELIGYLMVCVIFAMIIVARCFDNPIFLLVLAVGLVWFVYAAVHAKKLADAEAAEFARLRKTVRRVFWLVLAAVGVIANIFAGPIRFM